MGKAVYWDNQKQRYVDMPDDDGVLESECADGASDVVDNPTASDFKELDKQDLSKPMSSKYPYSDGWEKGKKYKAEPKCVHEGKKPVFFIEHNKHKCAVFALQRYAGVLTGIQPVSLLLDCTGNGIPTYGGLRCSTPALTERFAKHYGTQWDTISVDWPDMGPPPVKFTFWEELIKECRTRSSLGVSCVGAHGRTGTALTALAIVLFGKGVDETVKFVRHAHCKKAVEAESQWRYLDDFHAWRTKSNEHKA